MITGNQFLLKPTNLVIDVINNINDSQLQVCFIVDDSGLLIGSITDGDIRRGLINGFTTNSKASEIMQKSPIVISETKSSSDAKKIMEKNNIKQLPVINKDRKLLGVYLWDELEKVSARDNIIIIMAGGFGKRMMPLTNNTPKPMLEVGGKPILEHIILNARDQGFHKFVISLHYLGDIISEYFSDGSKFNVSIKYTREDKPLGTAGALSLLNPHPDLPFIVTNGDILTDINFANLIDFHISNCAQGTMAVKKYELQNPYGVVNTDGLNISSFEEKPIQISYVNAGIYVINPSALKYLELNTFYNMPDFFMKLKENKNKIVAYPIHETWADVGSPKDFSDANQGDTSA